MEPIPAVPAPSPQRQLLLAGQGARRAQSANVESMSVPQLPRIHPGLQKALTLQVEASPRGSGGASPLGASPRRVVCRICEESVGRDGLQRHSRVCAMLEAICKQVGAAHACCRQLLHCGGTSAASPCTAAAAPASQPSCSLPPWPAALPTCPAPPCRPLLPAQGGDVDALLTRLGNVIEEALASPVLDGPEFDSLEDLVAACRQVASLQPDGTRQPMLRCEAIAALLQGMLEASEAAQAAAGSGGGGSAGGGLSPAAEAYTQRVLRLVRRKLGELRTAVPGRMSDTGSGGLARQSGQQEWLHGMAAWRAGLVQRRVLAQSATGGPARRLTALPLHACRRVHAAGRPLHVHRRLRDHQAHLARRLWPRVPGA